MVETFLKSYANKFVSKWLIFLVDVMIAFFSFQFATLLRYNFDLKALDPIYFKYQLFLAVLMKINSFIIFRSYAGIVRHTSMEDVVVLFKALSLSFILLAVLSFILQRIPVFSTFSITPSIIVIDYVICLFVLIVSRFFVKSVYEALHIDIKTETNVIIYGTGYMGLMVKNTVLKNRRKNYRILCFIDDNPSKIRKTVEGIQVLSRQDAIKNYITNSKAINLEVILAIQNISPTQREFITEDFLQHGIVIKSIPPINNWINGKLETQQIQSIKIEDLLGRESIKTNNYQIAKEISDKVILVTGAAGSIGSEIVRQLLLFKPETLVLVDQAESALYDLETELFRLTGNDEILTTNLILQIGSVTNFLQMEKIFEVYSPSIIFHAAAYKHVPLMEKNPYEAVRTNVMGTKMIANLASKFNAKKFIMISTDKAVNPTNVMGASKRLSEMYVQALNNAKGNQTQFITTRFGNVLGSSGSVIPLFRKQIEIGGPVTVTHPDITRYFMTIPEACQLVLEACSMGKGGEIFVFDMGMPIKIVELAKKMIKLSGFEVDKDIKIKYSGLRPGEKLYEELLSNEENTIPTYHSKIMIAKVFPEEFKSIAFSINEIESELNDSGTTSNQIVQKLKDLIPEYVSNNSEFEMLDTKLTN